MCRIFIPPRDMGSVVRLQVVKLLKSIFQDCSWALSAERSAAMWGGSGEEGSVFSDVVFLRKSVLISVIIEVSVFRACARLENSSGRS